MLILPSATEKMGDVLRNRDGIGDLEAEHNNQNAIF